MARIRHKIVAMASWTLFVLLIAVLDCSRAVSVTKTKCPVVPGKSPFELNKFRGDWLLVAANADSLSARGKCGKYSVTAGPEKDSMTARFAGQTISKTAAALALDLVSQAVAGDKLALSHTVYRSKDGSNSDVVYKQSIVATDYDNYAVVLSCRQTYSTNAKGFGRSLFAEIWGRKATLPAETLAVLKNVVSSFDVDPNDVKLVDRKC